MDKQYVIVNMKREYCQFMDKKLVVFVSDIKQAQFFDSEMLAYEFMAKYKFMFAEGIKNEFYEIRCVVIIWQKLESK